MVIAPSRCWGLVYRWNPWRISAVSTGISRSRGRARFVGLSYRCRSKSPLCFLYDSHFTASVSILDAVGGYPERPSLGERSVALGSSFSPGPRTAASSRRCRFFRHFPVWDVEVSSFAMLRLSPGDSISPSGCTSIHPLRLPVSGGSVQIR